MLLNAGGCSRIVVPLGGKGSVFPEFLSEFPHAKIKQVEVFLGRNLIGVGSIEVFVPIILQAEDSVVDRFLHGEIEFAGLPIPVVFGVPLEGGLGAGDGPGYAVEVKGVL